MTILSQITKKKRKILIIACSGMAFFILGMMLSDKSGDLPILPLIGFIVFIISILYAVYGLRCPLVLDRHHSCHNETPPLPVFI
ncbi:hypothetical protein HKBW3S42_01501, partial [Candidatus Hakubella thermalkaliphila]